MVSSVLYHLFEFTIYAIPKSAVTFVKRATVRGKIKDKNKIFTL